MIGDGAGVSENVEKTLVHNSISKSNNSGKSMEVYVSVEKGVFNSKKIIILLLLPHPLVIWIIR